MALHSEELGFPHLADRYLAKALEMGPDAPAVLKCQVTILLNRDRFEEALAISRAALQAGLDDRWGSLRVFMRVVRDHGIDAGELDEASRYYEQHVPGLFADNPKIDSFSIQFAADLARLFQAAGRAERAMALTQSALAWYDATQPDGVWGFVYNITDVELHALAGHTEEALRLFAAAIDYGWRTDASFYINNKNLDSIAADEDFRRLVAVIDADLAAQHEVVEKMPLMGEYDLRSN
jgi:tetratricopeptide (TPR) repeat protein